MVSNLSPSQVHHIMLHDMSNGFIASLLSLVMRLGILVILLPAIHDEIGWPGYSRLMRLGDQAGIESSSWDCFVYIGHPQLPLWIMPPASDAS